MVKKTNCLLESNINKKKFDFYIKDPIHKEINFSSEQWLAEFVFSKELLRLQEIKQLGVSFKTFPSATHNRYMHSLGTYQVAQKFANHFEKEISIHDKKLFLVSALLHDIGHGPFSHIFEKITNINHEEMTRKIILSENLTIYNTLVKNKINPEKVIDVYLGNYKQEWISKLISSNLDVDRIDYMLRDSYYIGTCYSTIDIDFLIERSVLLDTDICFFQNTINYIESFLLGRYYMHIDIYDNKNSYIYEWSLFKIFERLKEIKEKFKTNKSKIFYYDLYEWIVFNKKIDIENYILLNDTNMTAFVDSLRYINDSILTSFVDAFVWNKGVIALNYDEDILTDIQEHAKKTKISQKYIFSEIEKNKKDIYYSGDKNVINIFNTQTKEIDKFPGERLVQFNKLHKNQNNKIILVNKTLIN